MDGTNELCVSGEILNEYEEILERLAGKEVAKLTLDVILNNPYTSFLTPYYKFNLIKSNSEFVILLNEALTNMLIKNTKQDMDNMNKTIKDIFNTYLNRLYSYMYQYQFDTGDN